MPSHGISQAWRARVVTLALLAAIVGCFSAEAELWPMSSFRLFSGLRSAESSGTLLVAVAGDGSEHRIDVQKNPTAARSALHQVADLPHQTRSQQRGAVMAWLRIGAMDPSDFVAVRLYRVRVRNSTHEGAPPQVLSKRLEVEVPL